MIFKEELVVQLFSDARERYNIKLKRDRGEIKPWTDHPFMSVYHMCNVFRDDDAVSQYIMRGLLPRNQGQEWWLVVLARLINNEESLKRLDLNRIDLSEILLNTSAYKLNTPLGLNNRQGILELVEKARKRNWPVETSLCGAWQSLCSIGLSAFIAYQAAHDLKGSDLPAVPEDADTWTFMGIGAERGALRLRGHNLVEWYRAQGFKKQEDGTRADGLPGGARIKKALRELEGSEDWALKAAIEVLKLSKEPDLWPSNWPAWHLGEAEHMLCEFDKLERWRQIGPAGARRFR
jgi:hypothetical protein